jgi:colanic acid biosynthesis glycosyl transferase WcaI
MRILIFGGHYEPDLGPSAPIFTMLCRNLVRLGHQVTMLTMVPHYPSGRVPPEYQGKWFWKDDDQGVEVIRLGLPSVDRAKLPQRMLQYLAYQIGATLAGWNKKYDAVFACSSALTSWLPFQTLVTLRNKPAVYGVYDVYPSVGIKLGIFRHKPVITLMTALERSCLDNAALVRVISDSFRPDLREMGVPDEKMVRGYDWVDTNLVRPLPRLNPFAEENGLTDKFVVMYAGNLGLSQGLEYVIAAADFLKEQDEILFLFVGDGASREMLEEETAQRGLQNVKFLPFQPRERLPEVLASANVSLVSLQRGMGSGSLPSKMYSIFASGRPLLISVDEGSEPWKLVEQAGAGMCVPPENPASLSTAILYLKNTPHLCEQFGRQGRIWAETHHSPEVGAREIESMLLRAIQLKNQKR